MLQKFKAFSRLQKIGLIFGGLLLAAIVSPNLQSNKASLNVQDASSKTVLSADSDNTPGQKKAPIVTTDTVTETEIVPFSSTTVNSSSLAKGQTHITTYGVNGLKTLTYKVTTSDGIQTNKELVNEEVSIQPITQVTTVGTYVPPAAAASNCDPNYSGCVPIASDVDCAGGSGNGPAYVSGPIRVVGSDIYGLDRDGDGIACE